MNLHSNSFVGGAEWKAMVWVMWSRCRCKHHNAQFQMTVCASLKDVKSFAANGPLLLFTPAETCKINSSTIQTDQTDADESLYKEQSAPAKSSQTNEENELKRLSTTPATDGEKFIPAHDAASLKDLSPATLAEKFIRAHGSEPAASQHDLKKMREELDEMKVLLKDVATKVCYLVCRDADRDWLLAYRDDDYLQWLISTKLCDRQAWDRLLDHRKNLLKWQWLGWKLTCDKLPTVT